MVRTRLRSLAWLASVAAVGASSALVAACSGQVSNGKLSSTAQPVTPASISGTVTTCESGSAHPNVCCEAGPGQQASCVSYPSAPFTQCASGATTYPDPRTCCPLDGNGACAAPASGTTEGATPGSVLDAGSAVGSSCVYACSVVWDAPPAQSGASGSGGSIVGSSPCCQTDESGALTCMASGASSGGVSGCTCACPFCDADGSCPPCPPCSCPEQPAQPISTTPSCDACPAGWQAPEGDPLLCCSEQDGVISCFSQGVPPPPPDQPQDAGITGTNPSCFGGGGDGPDGAFSTQCGCSEMVGNFTYTVTCTDPGASCACSSNDASGTGGSSFTVIEPTTSCNDVGALFNACGFPANGVSGSSGSTPGSGSSSGG